ncbi:hypothetical protein POJ06DRAFT_263701 [Lipomyces tetrasporus]|uniref:EF-hand domain-containing protein n=1 Tax=Lipomyces tetrasporus TaxID=54092 RepID=A0AAD7QKH7_9ASCO|nr:uncharacterized protein POJ06DRAFT_263701 [Lipomyces tetrasporus]KAJ8096901.1 hypothetical protein POJ06DRAFT_263701 [Lipomyces tetrasporus]
MRSIILPIAFTVLLSFGSVSAAESWAALHMREEHNIENYDAASFFVLHDSDNSHYWTKQDILSIYGVLQTADPTGHRKEPISAEEQDRVYSTVVGLMDTDRDGSVSMDEWLAFTQKGGELPDFGLGPGHHGDVEYEYEIHHWLKYHSEDENDENLNHAEDIEHERLFHHIEDQAIKDQNMNIPPKFRVQN